MTYTYAILHVSPAAYAEIRAKLETAGYQHAFHDDVIDMHGIALAVDRTEAASGSVEQPAPLRGSSFRSTSGGGAK